MNDYLEWMNSDEYKEIAEAEDKFFEEHWANDLLDAPHALIAVIETKISRAVLGREREIIKLLEAHEPHQFNYGEFACFSCFPDRADYRQHLIALIKGEAE